MENKNNEMNFTTPENENEVTAVETAELEFLPADTVVPDVEPDNHPEKEKQKDEETRMPEPEEPETEETPAPENDSDSDDSGEQNSPAYLLKLVMVLTLICTCIALLLAVVNNITKDKIAENVANQQQKAILAIFPEGNETKEYINDAGDDVYIVYKDGEPIGYCVNTTGSGFGGDVNVMVGIDPTGAVYGVKIVSMSETPGIGTKVQGESFLSRFVGQAGEADVDIISGATFSSKAVIEAVDKALAVEVDVFEITENDNAARAARMMQ